MSLAKRQYAKSLMLNVIIITAFVLGVIKHGKPHYSMCNIAKLHYAMCHYAERDCVESHCTNGDGEWGEVSFSIFRK